MQCVKYAARAHLALKCQAQKAANELVTIQLLTYAAGVLMQQLVHNASFPLFAKPAQGHENEMPEQSQHRGTINLRVDLYLEIQCSSVLLFGRRVCSGWWGLHQASTTAARDHCRIIVSMMGSRSCFGLLCISSLT